ncbi:DUF7878 domain-containing protein [Macrococcus equipercicus]|uniref:DUF7878 domain-containing protein n=1 Tax=Macrococcus equipercicus TaxID=69967 RepID=A0A9Q9F2E7_9STAP|nr:hypothetical protein [Macrococcus equipercicus]UTH14710.1 hypothetical protein KFV11_04985 [Macrococcus equipercicus]
MNDISVKYHFTSNFKNLSFSEKMNVANLYLIEGILVIKLGNKIYFEENVALLEFWILLDRWIKNIETHNISSFKYYTLELDENIPLFSLIPYKDKFLIEVIEIKEKVENLLPQDKVIEEFKKVHLNLSNDIQSHYGIFIEDYLDKVPF